MVLDKKEFFLDKYCKLEKKSGFVLNDLVIDVDETGIIFQTTQMTSFVAWSEIVELLPIGRKP